MGEQRSPIETKQNLIDDTTGAWDAFVAYVDGLTDDRWTGPKDAAGWSVKDHVSHVTKWDRAVIDRLRGGARLRETLGISEASWLAEGFDPMNEEVRRLAVDNSVQTVKAERDATWTDLVSLLGALGEELLAQPGAEVGLQVGEQPLPEPVLEVLGVYWGEHYREHLGYIRAIAEGNPV